MSRYLRLSVGCLVFLLFSISMVAQASPELYWALYVNPDGSIGFPNMVWFDLDGIPGPPPVAATPPIPIPYGAWTPQGGPWWTDAVEAPGQPGIFLLLTAGYEGAIRGFRTSGTSFVPCGSYSLPNIEGENGGVRVAPSGSFAVVVVGSDPFSGQGPNMLLKFPLNLAAPRRVRGLCLLSGAPTQIPVPTNTTIRNVDFNPTNPDEVVVSGYSNVVTFVELSSGQTCNVTLVNNSLPLTRLEARYRPDGMKSGPRRTMGGR